MIDKIIKKELKDNDNLLRVTDETTDKKSNIYATLVIPIDAKSDKEIKHILNAIKELKESGLTFDYGCGCGQFDIHLDFSLEGAYLRKSHKQPTEEEMKE